MQRLDNFMAIIDTIRHTTRQLTAGVITYVINKSSHNPWAPQGPVHLMTNN